MEVTHLQMEQSSVRIDAGELASYLVNGYEVMHQKGSPGWRSSDTEMFPIIGPTAEANFRVKTSKGSAVQDQHGLLREMEFVRIEQSSAHAVFEKVYQANTLVRNSKFPAKSTEEFLSWPYDFRFRKTMELNANGLTVSFGVSSEIGMPFMLGYHPAFELKIQKPTIRTGDHREVTLDDVLAVGSRALLLDDCTVVMLHDQRSIKLTSVGFRHFMCWTEVPNMVCIEPITFYPYAVEQDNLHEGFGKVEEDVALFSLHIEVLD